MDVLPMWLVAGRLNQTGHTTLMFIQFQSPTGSERISLGISENPRSKSAA
jgi:hypothetical protein